MARTASSGRNGSFVLAGRIAASLALATAARAEVPIAEVGSVTGEASVGGRVVRGDEQADRFRRYRDLRDGLVGDVDLRFDQQDGDGYLRLRTQNAGWNDQRYSLEGGHYGRFGVDLFYGELPRLFSGQASTPFVRTGDDTLALPAGFQATVAGAAPADRPATLAGLLADSTPVPLELRWIEGRAGFHAWVADHVRLESGYRLQDRRGSRAFAMNFGSPGGTFVNAATPIDDRIHELRVAAELVPSPRASLRLEYLGSLYENDQRRFTLANPLVATDATNAALAGRASVDPDNAAHQLSLVGTTELPVGFPARLSGSVAWGLRLQDERFLPHTRNPTITNPGLALPRRSLEGEVQTWAAQVAFAARPAERAHVDVRARIYDFDNRTNDLLFPARVRNDDSLNTSPRRRVASDYRVHEAETELGLDLRDDLRTSFGYAWEYWERSDDRNVEHLHEHGPDLGIRWRPAPNTRVRVEYAFRTRRGSDYDAFAFFRRDAPGPLDPVEAATLEFARIRRPDQADREQHEARVVALARVHPKLRLQVEGAIRLEDFLNSDYGLRERRLWSTGTEVGWQVHPRVELSGFYTFEKSVWSQRSRWRPRNFAPPPATTIIDDPSNDWTSRTRDRFHNFGATLDAVLWPGRLDARIGYLIQLGRQKQRATTPPGSVVIAGAPGDDAVRWPTVEDRLQAVFAELDYAWSERVSIRGAWRFEKTDLDDFRIDSLGPVPNPATDSTLDVFLGDTLRDAEVHIFMLRVVLDL